MEDVVLQKNQAALISLIVTFDASTYRSVYAAA